MRYKRIINQIVGCVALLGVIMTHVVWAQSLDRRLTVREQAIVDRIQSPAVVAVTGHSFADDDLPPRDGEDIYNTFCVACHNGSLPAAPRVGNAGMWQTRLGEAVQEQASLGVDSPTEVLIYHAIAGINGMPAKGGCQDCTDEEIAITVRWMIIESGAG